MFTVKVLPHSGVECTVNLQFCLCSPLSPSYNLIVKGGHRGCWRQQSQHPHFVVATALPVLQSPLPTALSLNAAAAIGGGVAATWWDVTCTIVWKGTTRKEWIGTAWISSCFAVCLLQHLYILKYLPLSHESLALKLTTPCCFYCCWGWIPWSLGIYCWSEPCVGELIKPLSCECLVSSRVLPCVLCACSSDEQSLLATGRLSIVCCIALKSAAVQWGAMRVH